MEKLAIQGGSPVIDYEIPNYRNLSGRWIGQSEMEELKKVISSGTLSFLYGNKVKEFETEFARLYGIKIAVASSSGTAAIHGALVYLNIGPGDEVILPAITDMGSVIPILQQNAIPIFADIDPENWNIDINDVKRKLSKRTKAIIAVHLFGYPCDMDQIVLIGNDNNIAIIEDCAQAFLATYKNRLLGTIGDLGCFSFQQSKHITTGDGGITISKQDELFGRKLQHCIDKGWPRELYREHLFLAPAYHMTELQAAVGIAQLKKLKKVVAFRIQNAELLSEQLEQIEGLILPPSKSEFVGSYYAYCFGIELEKFSVGNTEFAEALKAEGVPATAGYLPKPLYQYPMLEKMITYGSSKCPFYCNHLDISNKDNFYHHGLCPQAEQACQNTILLEWNEAYDSKLVKNIADAIEKVFNYYRK